MLTPFLTVLVLLAQAPAPASAASDAPLTVLLAPPDAAGVPKHLTQFSQEHVAAQLKARGISVVRANAALRRLPATRRRRLLRCIQTERRCLQSLGESAKTEVVLVTELTQLVGDYRVGVKLYTVKEGALLAEHLVPDITEPGVLDALTQSLEVVVPKARRALRPGSEPEPEPTPEPEPPQVVVKPSVVTSPETKPAEPALVTPIQEAGDSKAPAQQEPSKGLRRFAWAPAAGGLVFAGVGTYFYLDAKDKHDTLLGKGSTGEPLDGPRIANDGRSSQKLSRIAFGVGAAGLLTGAIFYLFPGDDEASVRPTASVGPSGGMVGLTGTLP